MFNQKLKIEIGQLKDENENLKNKLAVLQKEIAIRRSVVDLMSEAIPKEQQSRRGYMQAVAAFYGTAFKDKLAHLIYQQKDTLSRLGLTKQEEDIFRSNINCLNLIDEWFEARTNEYLGDLHQVRENLDQDGEFINNIKDKYL